MFCLFSLQVGWWGLIENIEQLSAHSSSNMSSNMFFVVASNPDIYKWSLKCNLCFIEDIFQLTNIFNAPLYKNCPKIFFSENGQFGWAIERAYKRSRSSVAENYSYSQQAHKTYKEYLSQSYRNSDIVIFKLDGDYFDSWNFDLDRNVEITVTHGDIIPWQMRIFYFMPSNIYRHRRCIRNKKRVTNDFHLRSKGFQFFCYCRPIG